ncbi:hypothetical protein Btru_047103 [Bulinus truncatus]|nr:hypothetical protein Btru_047103 [Bulinus truncatus]
MKYLNGTIQQIRVPTVSKSPNLATGQWPEDKIPHCGPGFVDEFVPCDDHNVFVCKFDAVELGQPAMLSLRADLYVTHNVSTYFKMDEACEATFKDGRAYRFRDMQTLSEPFFVSSLGTESIFWVRSKGQQCTAVTMRPSPANTYQSEAVGVTSTVQMMNWPCNKSLPVLCELDKTYDVTPPPTVTVNSYGSQIIVLNDQILVPSYILKLMTNQSNNMASQTQATNYFNLFCNISSSLNMSQKITLFSNFIPFFTESHIEPGLIPFRWQNMKKLDSEYLDFSMIEFNHYYHCEVNDLNSSTVLQSEHIFVRLSDYEIYSVHISLSNVSNTVVNLELVMLNASLRNQWNAVEPDLLYTTTNPHPEVSKSTSAIVNSTLLQDNTTVTGWPTNFSTAFLVNISTSNTVTSTEFHNRSSSLQAATEVVDSDIKLDLNFLKSALRNLTTLQPQLNFSVRPQLFKKNERKLVMYFYKPFQAGNNFTNMSESLFLNASEKIKQLFKQSGLSQFDSNSVQVYSIDWCWSKEQNDSINNKNYILPKSPANYVWKSPEVCAQGGKPLATVRCEGNKISGLYWGKLEANPLCDYSTSTGNTTNSTLCLQDLSQGITSSNNVEQVIKNASDLVTQLLNENKAIAKDVCYIADILQKSTQISDLSPTVVKNIMQIAATVNYFPSSILEESQGISKATNRILKSTDLLGDLILPSSDSGSNVQRIISGRLGLEVWDLSRNYATEPVVGLKLMANGDSENLKSEDITSLFSELNLNFNELLAAIVLPKTLIERYLNMTANSTVRLAMNIYHDTTLYKASESSQNANKTLNSKVIAAKLLVNGQEITDLGSERVATYFLPNKQFKESVRSNLTSCSYWDFNAYHGAGGWNNTGCTLQPTVEGRDVCFCSHLTNFAVLMSFYDQGSLINENELALTIISIIGLSLSIAGLSLSVMSFIFIKSLHHSRPQQTLFQLSLALISSWIVFLAGITQTSSHAGCIVVAVLLHYFILASFMWMLMEGILQYLLFVKVLNSYFSHYMWKTAIPAWGFPLLPVIITLSIDRNLYKGGSKYCWLSLDAFYYGFAIPVGLIILANIFLFIMVVISLCNRKDMSKYSSVRSNQTLVNIRASFICFCLLGLTWIFGFLAIDDARIVFQYLFCIFNSLQGFVIFMMMTVRDKNVRSFWHSKLSSCLKPSKKRAGASSETSPADSAVDSRTVRSNNTTNINFSNDDYQRVEIMQPHRMDISTPNDD